MSQAEPTPTWESNLLLLAERQDEAQVRNILIKAAPQRVAQLIAKFLDAKSTQIIPLLNIISAISFGEDAHSFDRRAAVLKECFRFLTLADRHVPRLNVYGDVAAFVDRELEQCPGDLLAGVIELMDKRLHMHPSTIPPSPPTATSATTSSSNTMFVHPSVIQLMPKILHRLSRFEKVIHPKTKADLVGVFYKEQMINRLISINIAQWIPRQHHQQNENDLVVMATNLCISFVDLLDQNLTDEQIQRVIITCSNTLQFVVVVLARDAANSDQVVLVVRLLLQIAKKTGKRESVARVIMEFFSDICGSEITQDEQGYILQPNPNLPENSKVIGQVLRQLNFSLRQDQKMASTFHNMIYRTKSIKSSLTYFNVALLLTVSPIYRFEEEIVDMLKTKAMTVLKDDMKVEAAPWVTDYVNYEPVPIHKIMLALCREYQQGWQTVTKGITTLGFAYLDSAGTNFGRRLAAPETNASKYKGENDKTATERLSEQGVEILCELYKNHNDFRLTIMENLETRIITSGPTTRAGLDLLEKIVQFVAVTHPTTVGRIPRIREIADCLLFMNAEYASPALGALQPLVIHDQPFQQALMLMLRKGMFSIDTNQRKFTLRGLLFLLEVCLSRAEEEGWEAGSSNGKPGRALMLEIALMVRRYLTYSVELKKELYTTLSRLLVKYKNREFAAAVYSCIHPQLRGMEPENLQHRLPFNLQKCMSCKDENCVLKEALPQLAACVCNAAVFSDSMQASGRPCTQSDGSTQATQKGSSTSKAHADMKLILNKLGDMDAGDYGLDKDSSFDLDVPEGQKNFFTSTLLMGTYEAFIEYAFRVGNIDNSCADNVSKLYKRYLFLYNIVKDKIAKIRDPKIKVSLDPTLPFNTIVHIVSRVYGTYERTGGGVTEGQQFLRRYKEFVKYLIMSASHHLQKLAGQGIPPRQRKDTLELLQSLGNTMFQLCSRSELSNVEDAKKKTKPLSAFGMEVLKHVVYLVRDQFKSEFLQFMQTHIKLRLRANDPTQIANQALQTMINNFIDNDNFREATSALAILEEVDDMQVDDEWLDGLTKITDNQDAAFVKAILTLILRKISADDDCLLAQVFSDIALAARAIGNDDLQGIVSEHPVFTEKNGPSCVTLVVNTMATWLDTVLWCIHQLRPLSALPDTAEPVTTQVANQEQDPLCRLMNLWARVIKTFNNRTWPTIVVDSIYRCATKYLKAMSYLTAWKLKHHTAVNATFLDLVRVVHEMNKLLSDNITLRDIAERDEAMDADHQPKKKKASKRASMNRAPKTVVPALVEAQEKYEITLLYLGKKDGKVLQYVKRSTARDFRIDQNNIVLESDEEEEEDDSPQSKRRRVEREEEEGED
ncbi:hypothetical protein SeMB42_g03110 [Synchytrium endobioticum]|uniref:FANCI solenoid 4 domain-containing protein n=1 Tax=Synchytrium endobioticum TaxID=286115 RepID=A0A507CMV7_9FUNG|nr:hypothetical protein SeLEV6574_g06626 [Synchytrium endobioticum]TPX48165.1 hypothetical protein SeMB42_g03110 [Synchytrium endobioticum]